MYLIKHIFGIDSEVREIILVTLNDFSQMTIRGMLFCALIVQSLNQFTGLRKKVVKK